MGLAKNQKHEQQAKSGKRGSVNNQRRLDAFRKGAGHVAADWGGCDERRIQAVVCAITELGGAVTFGLSRDKGAHSLTVMLDGERETLWFNGSADLSQELQNVVGMLEALQ